MASGRQKMLKLYRNLITESNKWSSYNYREFALRKVRHEFRENQCLSNPEIIANCYKKGVEALDMIKRQVTIGNLYKTRPLVIETKKLSRNNTNC